jgi:uncharacterized phage infection (PIP) family protein YhgE
MSQGDVAAEIAQMAKEMIKPIKQKQQEDSAQETARYTSTNGSREYEFSVAEPAISALARAVAERVGIDKEVAAMVIRDMFDVVSKDARLQRMYTRLNAIKNISEIARVGPLSETALDLSIGRSVPRVVNEIVGQRDEVAESIREIMPIVIKYKIIMDLLSGSGGNARQSTADLSVFVSEVEKRLDQKFSSRIDEISRKIESVLSSIEERRQWEKVRQEIESTVKAHIEPITKSLSDVISKVENNRSWDQIRKEIEEMVKKHTESLVTTLAPRRESPPEVAEIRSRVDAILSRLEQIEQKQKDEKLEKIETELRDLKKYIDDRFTRISIAPPESKTPPTEAAMVTISEKLRELNELVSNIKNAKETIESMMRELGTSPEAEKVRSELEALRMRIRELEEKTSMTKAIGDLVADPRKLRDMVGLFREIAEEINKLRSSIPQPQQAQTPVVTVTRPPPLKTFIGGESGGSGEAGGASQGAVQGEAGQGQG